MFSGNISTLLYLKLGTSTHTQLASTRLNILFANFLEWYQLETYIEDTSGLKMTPLLWARGFS